MPARGLTQRLAAMAREEQALARAVEHQHLAFGIDRARQPVAAAEPGGDGLAERFDALVGRIAAEIVEMRGEHRPDEGGIGCCGSPTERLIGGLPGSMPAISSVSRTNGERLSAAGAADYGRLALGGHHGHADRAGRARDTGSSVTIE